LSVFEEQKNIKQKVDNYVTIVFSGTSHHLNILHIPVPQSSVRKYILKQKNIG